MATDGTIPDRITLKLTVGPVETMLAVEGTGLQLEGEAGFAAYEAGPVLSSDPAFLRRDDVNYTVDLYLDTAE